MMPSKKLALVVVKSSHLRHRAMTAVLFLLGATGLAHADTVVSSLSNTLQSVSFLSGGWAASSFQMGPQQFILTNVTLSMGQGSPTSSLADVRVFADNA